MDKPVKVIFKYKNNNKKVQYNLYIFIGNLISEEVEKILLFIKKLNFYETITKISKSELLLLEKSYGEYWYDTFFISYHLNASIKEILNNKNKQSQIEYNLGKEWYNKHISIDKKRNVSVYDYSNYVYYDKLRHMTKKNLKKYMSEMSLLNEDETNEYNTTTQNEENIQQMERIHKNMNGGNENDEDNDEPYNEVFDPNQDISELEELQDENNENNENTDNDEEIYQEKTDNNLEKTKEMIKNVSGNTYSKEYKAVEFDTSQDNNIYDTSLNDIYKKNYIFNNYIFYNDTIQQIRNRICCSILNNDKFKNLKYLLPFYQYLWIENITKKEVKKITLGFKWIQKNNLLDIDIEPNINIDIYENPKGKLEILRDKLKRLSSKIKRDDDEMLILKDYRKFMTSNEIFMVDICNDLGLGYEVSQVEIKNLSALYTDIYYPKIKYELPKIIGDLNGKNSVNTKNTHDVIFNDLFLENEITNQVEKYKKEKIPKIVGEEHVVQSFIHTFLSFTINGEHYEPLQKNLNLYLLFDSYIVDENYTFIQLQPVSGQITSKYSENYLPEDKNILTKWFQNAPYGISCKIKIDDSLINEKYMGIQISESGRLDYKISWKEENKSTLEDIEKIFYYIDKLIKKINNDISKYGIKLDYPKKEDYNFTFINTIQKIQIPEKYAINHNELSDFCRYFYPYLSLLIEPKKRQSSKNVQESKFSKFGTYLRYKKISNYENKLKIEQKIKYFIKNYDFTYQELVDEISKIFNITEDNAILEIDNVKKKYPNIKKSRRVLKKLENIPKYKPPGIEVDIQGKLSDNYKLRISGARDKEQVVEIAEFINIVLYLYVKVYLEKNQKFQAFRDKIKKLTGIAKRRGMVKDVVNYEKEELNIKKISKLDENRLKYSSDKGVKHYSRLCQNSGLNNRKQPQVFTAENIKDLVSKGYVFNEKSGFYERTLKDNKTILRAINLPSNKGDVFYTCNPENNGRHQYIGIFSKTFNPEGNVLPCCFIKNQLDDKYPKKKQYLLKSIGLIKNNESKDKSIYEQEQLYILKDTAKIPEKRLGFLPENLNILFNTLLKNDVIIKNHVLQETVPEYYFKYGARNSFLDTISLVLTIPKETIIKNISKELNESIFAYLDGGNIKTMFGTISKYIETIKKTDIELLGHKLIHHILTVPKIVSDEGINIIYFKKKIKIISSVLEKDKLIYDYNILCTEFEKEKQTLFICYDEEKLEYIPICKIIKKNNDKSYQLDVLFENSSKIVEHIKEYYNLNCQKNIDEEIINDLMKSKKEHQPYVQILDSRNKVIFIVTNNKTIIPVSKISPSKYVKTDDSINSYLSDFKTTKKNIEELIKNVKVSGVYYSEKKKDGYIIVAIILEGGKYIPIKPEYKEMNELKGLDIKFVSFTDKIDEEIKKGNVSIDERMKQVNQKKYENELYQLFRLHLSYYLSENENVKNKIISFIENKNKHEIKKILYKIINENLYKKYLELTNSSNDKEKVNDMEINIIKNIPEKIFKSYNPDNYRRICQINKKNTCNEIECSWGNDKCQLSITSEMIITFINNVSEEFIQNGISSSELLQQNKYYVSDIRMYNNFTERKGQKILNINSSIMNKELEKIFTNSKLPQIGKRLFNKSSQQIVEINLEYPIKDKELYYEQRISHNSIYRAFANCHYWLNNPYKDIEYRNLGFQSPLQDELSQYFKGLVIDWLLESSNHSKLKKIKKYIDMEIDIFKLSKQVNKYMTCFILSVLFNVKINFYDENDLLIYHINNEGIYEIKEKNKINKKNVSDINIRDINENIDVLYIK